MPLDKSWISQYLNPSNRSILSSLYAANMAEPDPVPALLQAVKDLTYRVQKLEDTIAIRNLHHTYGYYIDKCFYQAVVSLFSSSPEASVHFLNGIWKGKGGISRLYVEWFGALFTGGTNSLPRGFLLDHLMMQDVITVESGEGEERRAKGRFRCFMQGGSHVSVPNEQRPKDVPEQFWEGGVYENEYVFENEKWKILTLRYNMCWQAEYHKGWSGSEAMKGVEKCFPEDKWGPDEIVGGKLVWPETRLVRFHYRHPVTGEWAGGDGV
jgi:hypothetical protein